MGDFLNGRHVEVMRLVSSHFITSLEHVGSTTIKNQVAAIIPRGMARVPQHPVLVHPSRPLEYSCSDFVFVSQIPTGQHRVPAAVEATQDLLPNTGIDLGIQGRVFRIGIRCLTMKSE